MNQKVRFIGNVRKASDSSVKYMDLYWPKVNLGIEYDSDQEHLGSEKIAKDASRKNALFAAGRNILTVTRRQLLSGSEMDKVARTIANHMGMQIRSKNYDEQGRRELLRRELLS